MDGASQREGVLGGDPFSTGIESKRLGGTVEELRHVLEKEKATRAKRNTPSMHTMGVLLAFAVGFACVCYCCAKPIK